MSDIPVLDAFQEQDAYFVWCQYCMDWHMHGATEGHRLAHCPDKSKSAYRETGYILRYAGEKTQRERITYKRKQKWETRKKIGVV